MTRPTDPPVRRLGADTRIANVVRAAGAGGATVRVVPAGDDKAETLRLFAEVLKFPAYFGHNLDALADSLGDLAAATEGAWTLVWDGARFLRSADPDVFEAITDILTDLAQTHPGMHVVIVER